MFSLISFLINTTIQIVTVAFFMALKGIGALVRCITNLIMRR